MRILRPEEIRPLRKEMEITQTKLADKAGVSQAYIAKIESGKADPKISTLEKISQALEETTREEEITAEQVMAVPIISISPTDEIKEAIKLMENHDISQIPVIRNNKQVGSLAEETIIHEISSGENMFELVEKNVEEVMGDPFPTVGTDEDLDTISHVLERNPAVLVLKKGIPKGIVTKADILQYSTTGKR